MIPDNEKIAVLEAFIHNIYMCRNITLNSEELIRLLNASDNYCRSADYPYDDYEEYRDKQFIKLRDAIYD